MYLDQLNTAATSFSNIDSISLHTDDPGDTGANEADYDGYAQESITWTTPSAGYMYGVVTFADAVGDFTHIGLWDGSTFITSRVMTVVIPSAQDLKVLVEFTAEEKL